MTAPKKKKRRTDPMRYVHTSVEPVNSEDGPVRVVVWAENGFLRALKENRCVPHLLEVTVEMGGKEETLRKTVLPVELMHGIPFTAPTVPDKIHIRLFQMKE